MIPDGWSSKTVRDITEYFRSGDPFLKREYAPLGIAVIAKGDIKSHGRIEHSDKRFIPPHVAEEKGYTVCEPGELLVTTRDLTQKADVLGLAAPVPTDQEYLANQGANVMRLKDDALIPYFTYWTNGPVYRAHMKAHFVGSTQIHIRQGDLLDAPIWLPPDDEREAIVGVLGALDDKIEQNRRTARVLERLARAIFRAWFIDFLPVKAKAAGAASFPGVPQEVFDTLPTEFEDSGSELGPIPQGWEVEAIGDVITAKGGGTPSTKEPKYWDGGTHHWATPKDMSRLEHPILTDTDRKITDAGVDKISSGLLPAGTVLMSSRAPVGYLAVNSVPTAINQGFIAMHCDGPLPASFVLFWAMTSMEQIKARAAGTTFAEISKKSFRPIPVVVPPSVVCRAFDAAVSPMLQWIEASVYGSRKLAELRDYLLPRLLSGAVRVGPSE